MFFILGWKDILRPIRDGYRHVFPSPDTGPTPDERQRQRNLDRLRGFEYFDTIDQLETWTGADSDPLQIPNTPLLIRPKHAVRHEDQGAKLLLCHDYCGNYHDYEAAQSSGIDEEMYTCENLQFIDTFVYFSHKLVCVPPPSWTNLLHRNGVKVLGTLLVEPQTEFSDRLLSRHEKGADSGVDYPIANQLALIAQHYGFDGWLVNIEKSFAKADWDPGVLLDFLRQLKSALSHDKKLIWYDSITSDNNISYQNELNTKNFSFANACEGILVNYSWSEEQARSSFQFARKYGLSPENVFFGIDVWAQNKSSFIQKRKTYGGGGTNTGIAVDKLANLGLSAGIFAPAWSVEHFPGQGHTVERHLWHGDPLSGKLVCSCGDSKYHPANTGPYITQRARQFPVGSESFFHTDFSRASSGHDEQARKLVYGGKKIHCCLSSQSILPHLASLGTWNSGVGKESNDMFLTQRLEENEGDMHLVIAMHSVGPSPVSVEQLYECRALLFHLSMPTNAPLQLTVLCKGSLELPTATVSFYLKFTNGTRLLAVDKTEGIHSYKTVIGSAETIGSNGQLGNLEALGVHVRTPQVGQQILRVLDVYSLSITRHSRETNSNQMSIHDVRVQRYEGAREHWRLRWSYRGSEKALLELGLPYSDVTGPFSYFCIKISGTGIGRVYGLECIVPYELLKELQCENGGRVDIEGFGFDGRQLARSEVRVRALIH